MRFLLALLTASLALALGAGCGPRSSTTPALAPPPPATNPGGTGTGQEAARNTLSTQQPALNALNPGEEFDYVLSASLVEELYQGSGRVLYDSRYVRPVSAAPGALAPVKGLCVVKLDAAATAPQGNLDGVVPFAFTALPGQSATPPGQGELLRIRFELLAQPGTDTVLKLHNDAAYLQLRDGAGRRLSFDLSEEVAAR